ncbi:MAG: hypothetical protein AB3N18_00725 [Allomuricauda sp.]
MGILKHIIFSSLILLGCKTIQDNNGSIEIINCVLNKGAFDKTDMGLISISLRNNGDVSIVVQDIKAVVKDISGLHKESVLNVKLKAELSIKPQSVKEITAVLFEELPQNIKNGVYGIYPSYTVEGQTVQGVYQTFFRVIDQDEITVFDIKTGNYQGVPVLKLDGGMSAEYVVEKSAENLTSAISHSWEVNAPGSGPNHVLGTPDFLSLSLNETVDFYNLVLGEATSLETVIISPGIPSMPYISNSLKAPVLPLHFLVSVNTVKEIRTILQTANNKGISSYATLSHDPSVPFAVSWIKILELPEAYKNFIKQHNVKNVLILGATGTSGGETKAKRILDVDKNQGEYAPESIYIMYPGTSPDDVVTLNEKIVDLKEFQQDEKFIQIADWESGINPVQIENFVKDSKSISKVKTMTLLAEDLGELYNLGTYSALALMAKNNDQFSGLKGIIFNPYLLSHPNYELKKGFAPMLYWQLVGANFTVDRMENEAFAAVKHYFPQIDVREFTFWLNSTRNFGASWSANNLKSELVSRGYSKFIEGNYDVDDVWDPDDGMESPTEKIYEDIAIKYKSYKNWNSSLVPLGISDYRIISEMFGGFELSER